jgi:Spy/CpxP family protein refolding chaperone
MREVVIAFALVGVLAPAGIGLAAPRGRQVARPNASVPPDDATVSPVEIQRMFDAYALVQAQEQLKISDDKFSQFLTRYRTLQDVRRKTLQERNRLLNETRRLLNTDQPDEAIAERVKSMQELEVRSAVDEKKAYDAIDQILDIRQQAKFRVFEENMERRKLELVTRARQTNRPKQ